MEGIMNLPADVGGATSQDGLDSFAPLIAAQQAARDMGYPRFTRELLSAGSEMDEAEVQEFLQTIRDAGLTSDDVSMMRRVVEAVFGDPNNYPEVRARLLAEGVPEDILPETFDLEFFVALRMAVEEAENLSQEPRPMGQDMPMDMPVQMAEGGIVGLPQMTPIAREMAAMGRNGDTMLAHITPQEAMMLQRMGGSGTINPYTGLPEFFLKKLFRGIGKAIKSVGRAVKKFAKSKVGRIVTGIALGAFLGPIAGGLLGGVGPAAAFGLSAGLGTFGSSLLAGDDFKTALRGGLTAGALSFVGAGVFGEAGFSGTPAAGSPTNFAQGLEKGISNIKAPFQAAADFVRGGPEAAPGVGPAGDAATQLAQTQAPAPSGIGPQPGGYSDYTQGMRSVDPQFDMAVAQGRVGPRDFASLAEPTRIMDRVSQGAQDLYQGAKDVYTDYLSPSRTSIQGRSADTIFDELVAKGLPKTADTLKLATETAAKEAPGAFAKYGPLAAVAGTTLAATGGLDSLFKVPEQEPGETYEAYVARRNEAEAKFRQERPEFFGSFLASPNQGIMSTQPVMRAAKGSGPQGVEDFPRKNGAINGPGTGTSDDIPAMLSDGEFVFTAKSVRNMGGGSRRKGAAKMYKLMKMLEGGPVSKTAEA